MSSIDELIENGYVKVGSKSYCEYWKKGEEVITISTELECYDDDQEECFEDDDYEESEEEYGYNEDYDEDEDD